MKKTIPACLFALVIIYSSTVNNLHAMDNKQQALKNLLEKCLDESNILTEHTQKQIDNLNLSSEELKSFRDQVLAQKPECIALVNFLKARSNYKLKLEVERLMFQNERINALFGLDMY